MRTDPFFFFDDLFLLVLDEESRTGDCSAWFEEESSEHTEGWGSKDVNLKVMILRRQDYFGLADVFKFQVPQEGIVDYVGLGIDGIVLVLASRSK